MAHNMRFRVQGVCRGSPFREIPVKGLSYFGIHSINKEYGGYKKKRMRVSMTGCVVDIHGFP